MGLEVDWKEVDRDAVDPESRSGKSIWDIDLEIKAADLKLLTLDLFPYPIATSNLR